MKPEEILVIPTACVWSAIPYVERGLIKNDAEKLTSAIPRCGSFMERSLAEYDPSYKQIIPYAVVRHSDSFFLLRRKRAQTERRLHDKFSIGVGGHINPSEIFLTGDWVQEGLARELHEELEIEQGYVPQLIGLINDDTTEVGKVHLGMLFEIYTLSTSVKVREMHKMEGGWTSAEGIAKHYDQLETWSQIVYDAYVCASQG